MVTTRSSSSRVEEDSDSSPPRTASSLTKTPPSTNSRRTAARTPKPSSSATTATTWRHTPTRLTLVWMAISLPLVIWDTLYVLLRPLTMPGGSLHWPLWAPYALYGEVDHVYGFVAFNARDGFTSAQGLLNAVETTMYLAYLYTVLLSGGSSGKAGETRTVSGREGARAVLIGFSAAVMTLSKTVLYWANEYYSGFRHIGHNTAIDLLFLWIIPNGAWLVGSTYMIWDMSNNIIDGLTAASSRSKKE